MTEIFDAALKLHTIFRDHERLADVAAVAAALAAGYVTLALLKRAGAAAVVQVTRLATPRKRELSQVAQTMLDSIRTEPKPERQGEWLVVGRVRCLAETLAGIEAKPANAAALAYPWIPAEGVLDRHELAAIKAALKDARDLADQLSRSRREFEIVNALTAPTSQKGVKV